MSNRFPNGDHDDGWTWLWCVVWATVVQVALITFCFIVRNAQTAVVFLVFLYLPGCIVAAGGDHPHMSASTVRILFLLSFAFYSVVFGTLVYYWHQYVLMLRSNGEGRPHKPLSEPEPETWDGQVAVSTDAAAEESAEELDEAEDSAESEPAADPPGSRGTRWLRCVIGVTAVQPILLLLCLVAPDSLLAAGIMTYFYIPARLLVDGFGLPAPVVLILFPVSVAVFSVFFGTVVCFGGPLVKRMLQRASAFKRRVRGRQGKKSSNCEYDGGVKWGCCVSVLVVLQPLLLLCSLLDDGGLRTLFVKYVNQPAEWLLPVSRQHNTDIRLLPVLLFLLFVVGTFYSVLFGSLFYWLYRKSYCLVKSASRKAAGK